MPVNKNLKSKWQDASNIINKYRWELSNVLKSFTDEERQNPKYKDLINDIKSGACKAIRDVSPEDADGCQEEMENKSSSSDSINWKSKKLWALIITSPVIVEVVKYIPTIVEYMSGAKGN